MKDGAFFQNNLLITDCYQSTYLCLNTILYYTDKLENDKTGKFVVEGRFLLLFDKQAQRSNYRIEIDTIFSIDRFLSTDTFHKTNITFEIYLPEFVIARCYVIIII